MKKVNAISLVACGVLLSSSLAFGASTIDSAFKEGKVSGALNIYAESTEFKGDASSGMGDPAYSSGSISLAFETAAINGFSAKAGVIGVHVFTEKHDTDSDADIASKALVTEAYGKYANDSVAVMIGRQAIDLEWMGDYHEAAVVAISAVPDTTIVLGYSDKMAVAGVDEISEKFDSFNGDKGAYVADVKYTGLKSVEFNPYAYSAPDLANWYGLKTTFTADMFGIIAHHAVSDVDNAYSVANTIDNGAISHIELNSTLKDLTAAVGYIKTDKDGVSGIMDNVGDNISPFDSGNKVYSSDAKTMYGSLGYTIADIELGALYGQTTYGTNDNKEKELNLTVGYSITEALSTSLLFANVNADENYESLQAADDQIIDQNYVLASVEYTF
jgi:hypothetical protein